MPHSQVYTIADPAQYRPALRGGEAELLVAGSGEFRAELIRIDFDRLWMQRSSDTLPRVIHAAHDPRRAAILFLADALQPAMQHRGAPFTPGEIAFYSTGAVSHHCTQGTARFATMSLAPDDLAAAAEAIAGRPVKTPSETRSIRPRAPLMARLMGLHENAGKLARESPATLANPATAKALEQELVHAMITCLTDEPASGGRSRSAHAKVIARFESFLESRQYEPVYLAEICAAVGVSERTLRTCCQEHLGMGPIHYLWLRRMHLAHRALLFADPASATVTGVATEFGFWELGRFSVEYRTLFGETPSASLHRTPPN
jgi:AraC-like DNA-binding protein